MGIIDLDKEEIDPKETPEDFKGKLLWGIGYNAEENAVEVTPLNNGILVFKGIQMLEWLVEDVTRCFGGEMRTADIDLRDMTLGELDEIFRNEYNDPKIRAKLLDLQLEKEEKIAKQIVNMIVWQNSKISTANKILNEAKKMLEECAIKEPISIEDLKPLSKNPKEQLKAFESKKKFNSKESKMVYRDGKVIII